MCSPVRHLSTVVRLSLPFPDRVRSVATRSTFVDLICPSENACSTRDLDGKVVYGWQPWTAVSERVTHDESLVVAALLVTLSRRRLKRGPLSTFRPTYPCTHTIFGKSGCSTVKGFVGAG